MKLDSIQIQEKNLTLEKAKDLVIRLIDNQIQNYHLQNMSDWERGQKTAMREEGDMIAILSRKKQEIIRTLESGHEENARVDIDFKLDLNVKELSSIQ